MPRTAVTIPSAPVPAGVAKLPEQAAHAADETATGA